MMNLPPSITSRLHYQHQALLKIIEDLTDEQMRRPVQPGKWSIFENIVHLATYQPAFEQRIHQILTMHQPVFNRYTAEADPLFYDNCERPTREIMHDLFETREALITEIETLSKEQLMQQGIHPVFGNMNIEQWIEFFLLHEAHHLFTIFRLAAAFRE